jgi:hypothetical protein
METLSAAVPDLPLPVVPDPDLFIVIATVLLALGLTGVVSAASERRASVLSILAVLLSLALFVWIWEADREAFGWIAIPEAFIEMVARFVN